MINHPVATCIRFLVLGNALFIPTYQLTTDERMTGSIYKNMSTLYEDLLTGYDKRLIPRINLYPPVIVAFTFKLLNVIDFETSTQKLSILGLFSFFWHDEVMTWNPLQYGGLAAAKVPFIQVWAPHIALAKSFDGRDSVQDAADVVFYSAMGNATWVHLGKYDVVCEVSIKFYPFDRQSCEMLVFVKDALTNEVSLVPTPEDAVGTQSYDENTEWKLLGMSTFRSENVLGTYYNGIVFELERRVDFILYTVIFPLILLSVLNVCVFIVPVDSGEKASTSVTIFLSYGIFVAAIRDELPHNSLNVSYLLIYIQILLLFSVFSVIYCFVQSWIYAHYGDAAVKFGFLATPCKNFTTNKKTSKSTKVNPIIVDQKDKSAEEIATKDSKEKGVGSRITWKQLMKRLDLIVFVVLLCFDLISSVIFFVYLSDRKNI